MHYKHLPTVRISPFHISHHSVPCLRSGGAGRAALQRLTMTAAAVQAFLPLKWSGRKQGQGCKILFPVFGGERTAAKIQTVKGLRVEFFSRCARENTTRPLTVRIAGAGGASVICERCRKCLKYSQNCAIIPIENFAHEKIWQ